MTRSEAMTKAFKLLYGGPTGRQKTEPELQELREAFRYKPGFYVLTDFDQIELRVVEWLTRRR